VSKTIIVGVAAATPQPPPLLNSRTCLSPRNKAKLRWFPFTCRQTAMVIRIVDGMMPRRGYSMRALIVRFVNDQSAATAVECGLIAAGIISVAIIAVVFSFGSDGNDTYIIARQ
jgi:Flp pilus assembly pilin Flp